MSDKQKTYTQDEVDKIKVKVAEEVHKQRFYFTVKAGQQYPTSPLSCELNVGGPENLIRELSVELLALCSKYNDYSEAIRKAVKVKDE